MGQMLSKRGLSEPHTAGDMLAMVGSRKKTKTGRIFIVFFLGTNSFSAVLEKSLDSDVQQVSNS